MGPISFYLVQSRSIGRHFSTTKDWVRERQAVRDPSIIDPFCPWLCTTEPTLYNRSLVTDYELLIFTKLINISMVSK